MVPGIDRVVVGRRQQLKEGVDARVIDVRGAGHTHGGAGEAGVAEALPFVFADDVRWSAAPAASRPAATP